MLRQDKKTGELIRTLSDGLHELRAVEGISHNGLVMLCDVGHEGPSEIWTYRKLSDAIQALLVWEPGGQDFYCAACGSVRHLDSDPPGPWIRHQFSNRRRLPIYGQHGVIVGFMHYVRR